MKSKIIASQFKKWRWKYRTHAVYELPLEAVPLTDLSYVILSSSENKLVELRDQFLHIHRHFHFDGATGAPDFESGLEWYAQHDAMCQLAEKYDAITPEMADRALHPRRRRAPWHLWIYYPAVRGFRGLKSLLTF